jgi:hypothetical protein
MTPQTLRRALERDGVVPISPAEWEELESAFEEVERHDTRLAGNLVIVLDEETYLALEEPSRESRVLRKLGSRASAHAFVEKRLGEYERMWDGCGCRIEYYR